MERMVQSLIDHPKVLARKFVNSPWYRRDLVSL